MVDNAHKLLTIERGILLLKLLKDLRDYEWVMEELLAIETDQLLFRFQKEAKYAANEPHFIDIKTLIAAFEGWYKEYIAKVPQRYRP